MARPAPRLQIAVERAAPAVLVIVAGRLDLHSVAELREVLIALADEAPTHLQVDLAGAEIGDASALGVLVGAHHRARRLGHTLAVGPITERTARVLRASRLDRVLVRPAVAPLTA